ncbi:MAG: hypothetical protein K0S34_1744, partial [Bacillales bacterium]|nr:hypothetical protein [Bacillales bacterium]
HGGHPCLKLTPTTAFEVRDFHPRDYAHAGHTQNKSPWFSQGLFLIYNWLGNTSALEVQQLNRYSELLFLLEHLVELEKNLKFHEH